MYKICSTFDSTDKGNIGPVTDALRTLAGSRWSLVTPAFPQTGRTVYKGYLFVGDVPLHESPLRHHPLNPMHDSNLVRVLTKQSSSAAGLLDHAMIREGDEAVLNRIEAMAAEGRRSIIADAIFDADLVALGRLAIRTPLSTGASGLGLGLARAVKLQGARQGKAAHIAAVSGHAAILAGSCSQRTLEQIEQAEQSMPVLRLDANALIASNGDVSAALEWAKQRLSSGPVLIAVSDDPASVRQVQGRPWCAQGRAGDRDRHGQAG